MTVNRIALNVIVFDAGTQARAALDQDHVGALAEAMTDGAKIPPIALFHDGNHYYIGDGFHRFMAAQRLQWRDIDATVQAGSRDDALWFALGANRTNGKNMTVADKRHAILLALKTWPDKSITSIAEQIGVNQGYASTVKKQVIGSNDLSVPARVTGKDGKSYPAARPAKLSHEITTRAGRTQGLEARRIAASEGVSDHVTKRLPRKDDADIVSNAVNALSGIISVFSSVDPAALSTHPRAEEWREVVADTIGVLRSFNKRLERRAV